MALASGSEINLLTQCAMGGFHKKNILVVYLNLHESKRPLCRDWKRRPHKLTRIKGPPARNRSHFVN